MVNGWTIRENIIVVHAIFGGLLGMIIWPLMAVAGRLLRSYSPRWVRLHYIVGWALAAPFVVITFATGTAHKKGDEDNWTTYHFRAGLALLLLGLLQPIYGTILHTIGKWWPTSGVKSIGRYLHPITGITIVVLGFIQVRTGFAAYHAPGHISYGVIIAWAVVLAVWSAIYVAGLALIPRQQRERVERRRMEKGEKRESMEGMVQRDVGRV